MKTIIKNRHSDVKLSLHDTHINKITISKNSIQFCFDYIFDYSLGEEQSMVKASITFENIDLDFCNIYIIKEPNNKKLNGKIYPLQSYVKKHKYVDLGIITETYHGYDTIWTGYLYHKNKIRQFMIKLWNMGDMIYHIES